MASEEVTPLEQTKKTAHTWLRKCQLLTFLCVLLLVLLHVWLEAFSLDSNEHTQVTILMWHEPFGPPAQLFSRTNRDHTCSPSCKIVRRRDLFPTADVVVFHNRELVTGQEELPMNLSRPPGQRWVWMSLESPVHNGDLRKFAGIFNLTMNYRRDADISIPYGVRLAEKSEGENHAQTNTQNKSILACWVVSNYARTYRRSKVHKALSAIVPVEVYGLWTNISLTSAELLPTISHCYFYLAFENSEAKDYITEKLWRNAYQSGAVPVVLGASVQDYEAVAPPHSFIHVDEFASVEELAAYLQQVAGDQKRYSEYFQWKRNWKTTVNTDWNERLCKICSHFDSLPPNKVYADLAAWDHATGAARASLCRNPTNRAAVCL